MKRCPVAVRLILSISLTAFSLASSGAAESVRRIGPFASAKARLTRGEEYPGASGVVIWTNGGARISYDFSRGGVYVALDLGQLAEGAKAVTGRFSNPSESVLGLTLRARDSKGDFYLADAVLEPKVEDGLVEVPVSKLVWRWGASTNAADRLAVKWPIRVGLLFTPRVKKAQGVVEVRDLRARTTADAAAQPDWTFVGEVDRFGGVYYGGEDVTLVARSFNLNTDGKPSALKLSVARVWDWRGHLVCSPRLADEKDVLRLTEPQLRNRFGAFRVEFFGRLASGNEELLGETRFVRLNGRSRPVPWCGTCFHRWNDLRRFDLMAAAGIGTVRNALHWPSGEKRKGEYETPADFRRSIDRLRELGIEPIIQLIGKNKIYDDPLDAEAFARWTAYAASVSAKDVNSFEIWNEPFGFGFGEPGKHPWTDWSWLGRFVEFSRKAVSAVRQVRPDATISVASDDYADGLALLKAGLASREDSVAFHPYVHARDPRPERFSMFWKDGGATLRKVMAEHGGASRLCITELGWTTFGSDRTGRSDHRFSNRGFYPSVSHEEQAWYLVRAYLMARTAGVEAICQYDFQDDGNQRDNTEHNFGLVFADFSPKPSFAAVAFLTRILGDARPQGELSENPADYRVTSFVRVKRRILAAWAVESDVVWTLPSDFGPVARCYDMMGNAMPVLEKRTFPLTESPIYVVEQ